MGGFPGVCVPLFEEACLQRWTFRIQIPLTGLVLYCFAYESAFTLSYYSSTCLYASMLPTLMIMNYTPESVIKTQLIAFYFKCCFGYVFFLSQK